MSLSLRGLLIAFPVVALIIGGMALFTYRSAIAEFRADAAAELLISNDAVANKLAQDLGLVADTQRKAAELMTERLRSGQGAAFDTIKAMAGGLPGDIESLYFFSPSNDLLILAPTREDRLEFYREAPAEFDFQDAEFSTITSPRENPAGDMRCTSLQQPIYDDTGQNWTTGCMLPVRVNWQHLGAWGISIPLGNLTQRLQAPIGGATTVIVSSDGKLIHHSDLARGSVDGLAANIDLSALVEKAD